jgi:hypothetical protein
MITWGYTDRFSWIPSATNYTKGDGLTLDCQYQPKSAYWELQEELARVLASANQKWNVTWLGDGTYRFSPSR